MLYSPAGSELANSFSVEEKKGEKIHKICCKVCVTISIVDSSDFEYFIKNYLQFWSKKVSRKTMCSKHKIYIYLMRAQDLIFLNLIDIQ